MIFTLANEIADITSWTLEDIHAIEKLSNCAFEGSHIVTVESNRVIESLLRAPAETFGSVTKAVLKKISTDFSFQGWLRESGLVSALVTTPETLTEVATRSPRVLSLDNIRTMSLDPATLLAENLVDAKTYFIAAKHYLAAAGPRGMTIAAVTRGGGGSTIVPELKEIVDRANRVCLAVTDSDQAWPNARPSDTSTKCQKIVRGTSTLVGHGTIPVRELENLIPPSVLIELDSQPNYIDAVRSFEDTCNRVPPVRTCGDIKDGVCGSRIFRLPEGSPERLFLSELLTHKLGKDARCLRDEDCERERNGSDCECVCVPKIGAAGEKFHEWLDGQTSQKALESFKHPWRDSWLEVGAMVFSWCCARPRIRA